MLLLAVGDGTEVTAQHVEIGILHDLGVALLILQGQRDVLLRLVAQIGQGNLVTRTLLGDDVLQLTELRDFLSVDVGDHVVFLQACVSSGTVFHDLCDVDTFHRAEIHLVALLLLSIDIHVHVGTFDADHGALYVAVLLDVGHHLVHDGGGDGKAITDIRTCLGVDHGVDTDQRTVGVYQCTTRVTLVDGSISLNHRRDTRTHRTGLGRYDTCGHGVVQS